MRVSAQLATERIRKVSRMAKARSDQLRRKDEDNMSARMKARYDWANLELVRMSAPKLKDDSRVRLVPPMAQKPATATIAECLAAKGAR